MRYFSRVSAIYDAAAERHKIGHYAALTTFQLHTPLIRRHDFRRRIDKTGAKELHYLAFLKGFAEYFSTYSAGHAVVAAFDATPRTRSVITPRVSHEELRPRRARLRRHEPPLHAVMTPYAAIRNDDELARCYRALAPFLRLSRYFSAARAAMGRRAAPPPSGFTFIPFAPAPTYYEAA